MILEGGPNIHSCLSESVSESSYSSLSEYLRRGFFPSLPDLQPASRVSWNTSGDLLVNFYQAGGVRCYPVRPGGEGAGNVWVWQRVFVVISHPHSLLPSYCIPTRSSGAGAVHRHCLEVWSGVGRYIRGSLRNFFNLLTKEEFIAEFKRIELSWWKPWNSPQIKVIDFGYNDN